MIDKGHTLMNTDDFDEEYEPFYDFSGTYEENFVGKNLDDFDLSEEIAAWPHPSLSQTPTEGKTSMKEEDAAIKEEVKEDDDWEDIDAEDG